MLPIQYLRPTSSSPQFPEDAKIEFSTQRLARQIGIEAADTNILTIGDQYALASTRFDRFNGRRLHMEDLNQVLGHEPGRNYSTPVWKSLFDLLKNHNIDITPLVQQIIFNTTIGNTDAHLKNYSILETPTGYKIAPLYDSMALTGFTELTDKLALGIGTATYVREMTRPIWLKWATRSGLDPEFVDSYLSYVKSKIATEGVELFRQNGVPYQHISAMVEASKNVV